MGDIDAVQELSKFISNLKQQISKMHVKAQVLCLVALLFAVSNARYIGPGASGQCNGVQFFPECSPDQFIMNMMQCNRIIQSGYPYQSKGQCMSNADRWISCMQTTLENCMSSNCPSMLGNMLGGMNFMPVSTVSRVSTVLNKCIKHLMESLIRSLPCSTSTSQ